MRFLSDRSIAIVGYAETKLIRRSGKSAVSLAGEALSNLIAETGVGRDQIDGLTTTLAMSEAGNPFWSNLLAESLGLTVSWCQATDLGGASVIGNIARAAAAVHAGACNVVVCIAADAVSSRDLSVQTGHRLTYSDPFGYAGPLTTFALLSSVYDHRYGLPHAALAKLAVAQRKGAVTNENACEELRRELTEQDYFDSRLVSDPLRLLDCVMRCDGANAFLVMSTRLAKEMHFEKIAHPIAYAERVNFDPREECADVLLSGFSEVAPRLFASAGMRPSDIQMLHLYDDFLVAVLLQLEQIGFCEPGMSGEFVSTRNLEFSGDLPVNPGGGQISCGQPGLAGGGVNAAECLRQLFGDAGARQVHHHANALLSGIGFIQYARNWGTSNLMLMERSQ